MRYARRPHHREHHHQGRVGWLRAAVLGSNDAIVSTSALMIGVAASDATTRSIVLAGVAGLVGGAMSMAVGEYVSVSSQSDSEEADIATEKAELTEEPAAELAELTGIYIKRGLDRELAEKVARALTAKDPLAAHLRDELGIEPHSRARPLQASVASAVSFAAFALLPLAGLLVAPTAWRVPFIAGVSLVSLTVLGALGAHLGGAPKLRATLRVVVGGALAMGLTAAIGHLFGVAV
ncbi:MAG: VIT family protein [Archangiaceae bacterium]|nr:VIT family protein [Archangiaceae bacterium]